MLAAALCFFQILRISSFEQEYLEIDEQGRAAEEDGEAQDLDNGEVADRNEDAFMGIRVARISTRWRKRKGQGTQKSERTRVETDMSAR